MLIRRGLTLSDLKSFDPSQPIRYADLAVKWGPRGHESSGFQPRFSVDRRSMPS
jgi:hypothetical protein